MDPEYVSPWLRLQGPVTILNRDLSFPLRALAGPNADVGTALMRYDNDVYCMHRDVGYPSKR